MTMRIKIINIEPSCEYDTVVVDTGDHVVTTIIKPGGSADFLVHSAKSLVVSERLTEKSGEGN